MKKETRYYGVEHRKFWFDRNDLKKILVDYLKDMKELDKDEVSYLFDIEIQENDVYLGRKYEQVKE